MTENNIYRTNKVMQIIGKQHIFDYIGADFCTVYDAHQKETDASYNSILALALDFYCLGLITGKRLERAAKNGKEFISLAESVQQEGCEYGKQAKEVCL